MIQRGPDKVFAILWLTRYTAMFAALLAGSYVWLTVASASFFPVEGVAFARKTGLRDSLSELWTFTLRSLSKHERAFAGWNWLAVVFATFEGGVLNYLLDYWAPGFGLPGDVMAVGIAAMCHAHWLRPDIHG